MIALRYWPRRVSTTSSLSWERYRRASSRFRCRFRCSAFSTNAFPRHCGIARRPSFSRRPPRLTTSEITRELTVASPRRSSSKSTRWTWTPRAQSIRRFAVRIRAWPTSSTRRVRPASRPVSSSRIKTSSANFEQALSDYFRRFRKCPAGPDHVVSWLPFYHDMGLMLGIGVPLVRPTQRGVTEPDVVPATTGPLDAVACHKYPSHSLAHPIFAFDLAVRRTSDDDMAGHDLGDVLAILNGSERIHAAIDRALQ